MCGYLQALVQSLDSNQQEALLIELLQDWGGVELARCMMQRSADDDNYQPPQGTPGGVGVGKAGQWRILWNAYAVRCIHAPLQPMCSTIFA